jgi:hypothetical protein
VIVTLEAQSATDWTLPYSEKRQPEGKDRFTVFLRCASHLDNHVGQINYLSRQLALR